MLMCKTNYQNRLLSVDFTSVHNRGKHGDETGIGYCRRISLRSALKTDDDVVAALGPPLLKARRGVEASRGRRPGRGHPAQGQQVTCHPLTPR